MYNQLHKWRLSSTADEWNKLAELSGTSTGYLNQIAYGNRNPSPKLAEAIEKASKTFNKPTLDKKSLVFGE